MDLIHQQKKLAVTNFDKQTNTEDKLLPKRYEDLLPNNIHAVLCGPSAYEKTNALLALLTHQNGLKFENVHVYSKSSNQPKDKLSQKLLEPLEGINYYSFCDHELVISPDKAKPNSIMIFDDISCEKEDNVRVFYCMRKHQNADCFYLCQSYAQIPKHLVRDDVNFLVLFRQDDMNLKHIYSYHVNTNLSYNTFNNICSTCWRDSNFNFLVIDKDKEIQKGRFRKGFDTFISNIENSQ